MLFPSIFSDVDGKYAGFDGEIHTLPADEAQYANYSMWDTYRSHSALVALLFPDRASDMMQSLIRDAEQGGWLPRWPVANDYSGVMVGDPVDAIIATTYAFGAQDLDTRAAMRHMLKGAMQSGEGPHGYRERPGLANYKELGYVPTGEPGVGGSASTTLEYTIADFSIAQFAEELGDRETYETFIKRALYWKNLFNRDSGYIQPREADGSWTPGFEPTSMEGFVEGNGAQYTWMVAHDFAGLFEAMGGKDVAVRRLDEFFSKLDAGFEQPYFNMNDFAHSTPWAYNYAGAPWKTQDTVRRIVNELYAPFRRPDNDDMGADSAWYVWATIGLYPASHSRPEFLVDSPLFPEIKLALGSGRTLRIKAPNASADTPYVQSLRFNGRSYTKIWLPASALRVGGTLEFALDDSPNPDWGSRPQDAPYSVSGR